MDPSDRKFKSGHPRRKREDERDADERNLLLAFIEAAIGLDTATTRRAVPPDAPLRGGWANERDVQAERIVVGFANACPGYGLTKVSTRKRVVAKVRRVLDAYAFQGGRGKIAPVRVDVAVDELCSLMGWSGGYKAAGQARWRRKLA